MLKTSIDTARAEQKMLRRGAGNESESERWNNLIKQWKQELKELTGEDY
jgi:hypothetical protein